MYGFIYLTTNNINGKKYVGMCKYTHEKNYLGSGKLLKEDIKKFGKENFFRVILEHCDTFEILCAAEKKWIDELEAVSSVEFYNLNLGGFGGCSESMKEYWSMFTKTERKKLREWSRPNMSGQNNPMFGRKHSVETRTKIGKKSIGRNWGRHTPVNGANNPMAKSIIVLYDDGRIEKYLCIKDFCDKYQYNYSTIKSIYRNGNYSKKYRIKIVNA